MKILILGGSGMLGHELWRRFSHKHETWVTLRRAPAELCAYARFDTSRALFPVNAAEPGSVERAIRTIRPDVVLNCIGIIKQLKEATNAVQSISLNALLPHQVGDICGSVGARLILFSTDCVFSGRRGGYSEQDAPDAEDLYGRTKLLGEIEGSFHVVTIRSSIIGQELGTAHSLVNWFLSQRGRHVRGFRRAIYSGFTTIEMARIVDRVIEQHPALAGLWQVASKPIAKYDLLRLLRDELKLDIVIEPDDTFVCDRSLNGTRFEQATGYHPPDWPSMIKELAEDIHRNRIQNT